MEEKGLPLEETLKAALAAVEGLSGRVCPVVDIQKNTGPLAVYEQQDESQEHSLDGLSGLCSATFHIHVIHGTYQKMRLLSEQVKQAVQGLRQSGKGSLWIEEITVKLASPDIYESHIQQYRRTYQVTIQYQIKEDM